MLPLSYAVDAMTHLTRGTATGDVWLDLGVVAAFALAGLGAGGGDAAAAYALSRARRSLSAWRC